MGLGKRVMGEGMRWGGEWENLLVCDAGSKLEFISHFVLNANWGCLNDPNYYPMQWLPLIFANKFLLFDLTSCDHGNLISKTKKILLTLMVYELLEYTILEYFSGRLMGILKFRA